MREHKLWVATGGLAMAMATMACAGGPGGGGGGTGGAGPDGGGGTGGTQGSDAATGDRSTTANDAPAASDGRAGDAAGGVGGGGGAGGGSGIDAASADRPAWDGAGPICGEQTTPIMISPKTPDVVLGFDRSGSMGQPFGTSTRYRTVQPLLKGLVTKYEDRIRWGYEEFPAAKKPKGCWATGVCIRPDFLNAAPINKAIDIPPGNGGTCMSPPRPEPATDSGSTPTPDSVRNVREFYQDFQDGVKERYLLLATDGEPACGLDGTPRMTPDDQLRFCDQTVDQIRMLLAAGVKTVVLGVSEEVADSACLDRMAQAGGAVNQAGPLAYYDAKDPALLEKHLSEIVAGLAKPACRVDLTSAPADHARVAVFFNKVQVPWDPTGMNGWSYAPGSTTQILIHGTYCTDLQAYRVSEIGVLFGCPPCVGTAC